MLKLHTTIRQRITERLSSTMRTPSGFQSVTFRNQAFPLVDSEAHGPTKVLAIVGAAIVC